MKPVIGINTDLRDGPPRLAACATFYIEAVLKAGAIPLMVPPMNDADLEEALRHLNGFLLIGGRDYDPALYGEKPHETIDPLDKERNDFDYKLVQKIVRETHLPLLGICGGSQILNIGLGGSLVQDIPSAVGQTIQHSSPDGYKGKWNRHLVKIIPDTRLAQVYANREVNVPTSHHQAVKQLGRGLTIAAKAEDGVVEAVELEGRPFVIGVQWHPERDFDGNKQLFIEFVKQATLVNNGSK